MTLSASDGNSKRPAEATASDGNNKKMKPSASACQISWSTIWKLYDTKATASAKNGDDNNEPDGIYDLLRTVTTGANDADDNYLDISPITAMGKAKAAFEQLPENRREASGCKNWKW